MAVDRDALVALGVVARPHGVRGEVHVHLFNPESRLLLECDHVVLRLPDGEWVADIKRSRPEKAGILMHFAESDSREDAEELRGAEVCIPRAALPPVGDDEFYHHDVIGLRVEDENGKELGRVEQMIRYPAAECFLVRAADGDREVPNVDAYIVAMDIEGGRIVMRDIDGLDVIKPRKPKA